MRQQKDYGPNDQGAEDSQSNPTKLQAPAELSQVAALKKTDKEIVLDRLGVSKEEQAQDRSNGQGQKKGAAKGEGIGLGHGAKNLPFRPLHGEERQEGTHHDQGGIQQAVFNFP